MASVDSIQPGEMINVKVVKQPRRESARKTLTRVLSKDETIQAELQRRSKLRKVHYDPQPRGGRLYAGHLKFGSKPVEGDQGDHGTVKATLDVLRDLKSVSRFIEVEKA